MAGGNKGYIWLHRELQDNPLWNSEPFSKGQAWVDMLLRANHQRNEFIIGNELIVVERGQFFTSELKLAEKWKWSRKKVRAYLSLLKTLKMATTVGTSKGTMVTIENYALYQCEGTTKDTAVGTSKEHQRNIEGYTNNNDKELIKNDKEISTTKKPKFIPPTIQEVTQYCKDRNNNVNPIKFIDFYTSKGWLIGKNKMVDWKAAVRTWEQKEEKKLNHEGREIDDAINNINF